VSWSGNQQPSFTELKKRLLVIVKKRRWILVRPLNGIVVLDFSEYLAGPSASLRLADLGARVIKIERKGKGDPYRKFTFDNKSVEDDSLLFRVINRGKESFECDFEHFADLKKVRQLIAKADVLIESFTPGVMEQLGLDYASIKNINPKLVYGSLTGYGKDGPWAEKPSMDLFVQCVSGMTWLNGDADHPPLAFGLPVVDLLTGSQLVQGILSLLVRRGRTQKGGLVEVSLLETALDFQFEVLTTHLNDGGLLPTRSSFNSAHAYLGAPYGIYETGDGHIAISMGSILQLGKLIQCQELLNYSNEQEWFTKRDEIKEVIAKHLKKNKTIIWIDALEAGGYWCADVYSWDQLINHEGFKVLDMIQEVGQTKTTIFKTTRCPITINGERLTSQKDAPSLGENSNLVDWLP
jgi:CoA:oxalate CoA-transferase